MIYSSVITFGSNAIQVTDPVNGVTGWPPGTMCRRILIEPLRGNTAAAYVGLSTVTNTGTGAAIQELAIPAPGVPLDRFDDRAVGGAHNLDTGALFVHGATGQKVKVSLFSL